MHTVSPLHLQTPNHGLKMVQVVTEKTPCVSGLAQFKLVLRVNCIIKPLTHFHLSSKLYNNVLKMKKI